MADVVLEIVNLGEFLNFTNNKGPKAITEGVTQGLNDIAQGIQDVTSTLVPVDTGALQQSISVTVSGDTLTAVAGEDYASYVDQGTSKMSAEPFFEKPIEGIVQGLNEVIEKTIGEKGLFD